jgi:hypothetical protein
MTKPVPIAVTLAPGLDQHGAFQWQMGIDPAPPQPPPYPAITVSHGNTAAITFTIQPSQQTISFATVPLLVPPKSDGVDAPTVNGASMTFTDHNLKQDQVPYVLVFNGAPKLDPIIKNDGGGSAPFAAYFASSTVQVASLVIVAVVVFLIARAIYRKRGT